MDFNPRPREEGDSIDYDMPTIYCISIHALVKRATKDSYKVKYEAVKISIHALVKRATRVKITRTKCLTISIHALVKRATKELDTGQNRTLHFNPRPREEGDEVLQ